MSRTLSDRLKTKKPDPDYVRAGILSVIVAGQDLYQRYEEVYARFGVSPSQFNILRILRGVHPEGQARGAIAGRMVTRAPDVTRLIDRMEKMGLVERVRSRGDRRLSVARITKKGMDLLDRVEPHQLALLEDYRRKLSKGEWLELMRLCEPLYREER